MAFRGNMKKRLGRANSSGARFAAIIGDDELDRGSAQLKNLQNGEQSLVPFGHLVKAIRA
jgi:histidyl-tRNA synthetase